ncbi:MAG TPA: thermopsin family protease [Thermoplasmata archaeon]|nr:thermopsin family protease [Thermoplasmata archaeon]
MSSKSLIRSPVPITVLIVLLFGIPGVITTVHLSAGPPGAVTRSPSTLSASHTATPSAPAAPSTASAVQQRVLAEVRSAGVPLRDVFLPNFHAPRPVAGAPVTPSYTQWPAPIGVATYAVHDRNGTPTPYVLTTRSFEGSTTFNNLTAFYADDDAPWYLGEQLNAVLGNVTLLGNSSFAFWTQNVVMWSSETHLLQFIDNVWNFSSPSFDMTSNVFNSTGPSGQLVAPVFYYGLGPVLNISLPFSLDLYLNASTTNVGGHPDDIAWFNFTVIKSGHTVATGTYDHVVFNSQPAIPVATIPAPLFRVDGGNVTPTGFIPWDAELVLCGPGGGSTTSIYTLNASMNLQFWNTSLPGYSQTRDAWNVGSETGETVEGVATWFDKQHIVHLGPGPTIPEPMWGASPTSSNGFVKVTGSVSPANSFLFLNKKQPFNRTAASWAPVATNGNFQYLLSPANYSGLAEFSNYDPAPFVISQTNASTWNQPLFLLSNTSRGIYTPLAAWGDPQLAAISSSGSGSAAHPLILYNNQYRALEPEFGTFNDFGFPVFSGLMLTKTRAHVDATDLPTFAVNYRGPELVATEQQGLPDSNELQLQLFAADNVSIDGAASISGWFTPNQAGFPVANLLMWNSSYDLVASNTFLGEGSSMLLYGGSHNVVWGNWFRQLAPATAGTLGSSFPVGLAFYSSGNTVYNNFFNVSLPALSPSTTIYTETFYSSNAATFTDAWNISARPTWEPSTVNGFTLSGNIVGGSVQGGNYWSNYGTLSNPLGVLPYNDGGAIANGGDYLPLRYGATSGATTATFRAAGGPAGVAYSVTIDGYQLNSTGGSVVVPVTNGSYSYTIGDVPAGWSASPTSGMFSVAGAPVTIPITFTAIPATTYTVTFEATGAPFGSNWSVTLNGSPRSSTTDSIAFSEPNGSYAYSVAPPSNWRAAPSAGTVNVTGASTTVRINLTLGSVPTYSVTFTLSGAPSGASWSVSLNGASQGSTSTSIVFTEPNGSYTFAVSGLSTGWTAAPTSGTVPVSGADASVNVRAVRAPAPVYAVTLAEVGLPAGTVWSGSLAGGAISTNLSSVTIWEPNGSYPYLVTAQPDYTLAPSSGMAPVNGGPSTVTVRFSPANGWINGTVMPGNASLTIDGQTVTLNGGAFSVVASPQAHALVVVGSGYVPYFNNVSVSPGHAVTLTVSLARSSTAATTSSPPSHLSTLDWGLLIGLAALALIFLLGTLYFWNRSRRPPALTPVAPATTSSSPSAKATAPADRAGVPKDWEEGDPPAGR